MLLPNKSFVNQNESEFVSQFSIENKISYLMLDTKYLKYFLRCILFPLPSQLLEPPLAPLPPDPVSFPVNHLNNPMDI